MRVDMRGMDAAFGQDVQPKRVEHQFTLTKIELEILGKGRDMFVERFDQILEDRKAVGQVIQRGIGGVARIAILFAPVLTGLIILGNREAGGGQFIGVDGLAMVRQGGVIEAGGEKRFDV